MKKWQIRDVDPQIIKSLSAETGLDNLICSLLAGRGIVNREAAEEFFNSTEISSPLDIADMEKAADAIRAAVENGDKITVYGDYDCDGVTSTVMLLTYLQAIGADCGWYIPSRDEGYGMNIPALEKLIEDGTRLIITVDNGISALEEAEFLAEKGITLVITDHHQVPEEMPVAAAIVDPHRPDDYSDFKELAGCGVVLKLIMAMENDADGVCEQFGDLAAIGTVGDLVPLRGENRAIVKRGCEAMSMTENVGLYSLLKQCRLTSSEITSTSLAFTVCPRINAAGRFSHPREAAELFLCENPGLASAKAENLTLLNTKRKEHELEIIADIEAALRADKNALNRRVLVVSGENWSHGVIGIVAARLLSRFGKPVIIITAEGETARGSARSVPGFSLYKLLCANKDYLLKFGGHTKAAGFSLETKNIEAFKAAVLAYAEENYPAMPADCYLADKELLPGELTRESVKNLSYLAPFGEENPAPLFIMRGCKIKSVRSLKEGKYVSFNVGFGSEEYKVLDFNDTYESFGFAAGETVDILCGAELNEYNGAVSITLRLKDVRTAGFLQDKYFAAAGTYEKLSVGEKVAPALVKRIIPEKKDLMQVYDVLKNERVLSSAARRAGEKGINYCMFRVSLDVFEELGLASVDPVGDSVALIPAAKKADLSSSVHLAELRGQIEKGE